MSQAAKFRKMLAEEPYVFAGGCYSPLTAKIAESQGMKMNYLSGYSFGLAHYGKGDLAFYGRSEIVDCARRITAVTDIPLISDADTGYGDAVQTQMTVQEFERAGVAGIHIEDQWPPKRCGHIAGKRVIPLRQAAGKYKAAVDAKKDDDFIIIARTDAYGAQGGGLQNAIDRGIAYADQGVDMLWIELPDPKRGPLIKFMEEVRKRHPQMIGAFNYSSSFKWSKEEDPLTFKELGEIGYKYIFITLFGIHAGTYGMIDHYKDLAKWEQDAQLRLENKRGDMYPGHHLLGDIPKYQEIERMYDADAMARQAETEGFKDA